MHFFIPGAENPDQAEEIYSGIREFLTHESEARLTDRRVFSLDWIYEGRAHTAVVGQNTTFNGELVVAILYDEGGKLYHVCTQTGGVNVGQSLPVGEWAVKDVINFE